MTNVYAVERAMEEFKDQLEQYKRVDWTQGGAIVHLFPLKGTQYYLGTFTAFDNKGLKSEDALPFKLFIETVNELEQEIEKVRTADFTGTFVGWKPTELVKDFLFRKRVHRLFFLSDSSAELFVKSYNNPKKDKERKVCVTVFFEKRKEN